MRLIGVLGAICALSQTAAAQTGECRSIADSSARLACYDKAAQPMAATSKAATSNSLAARPPAAAKPQASTIDGTKYVDSIGDEDAALNAKLHNICRGC